MLKFLRRRSDGTVISIDDASPEYARRIRATLASDGVTDTVIPARWEEVSAGSAFAHLTETSLGADNYYADGVLYFRQATENLGNEVFGVLREDESDSRLSVHDDGSLHFGDGTNAPNGSISYDGSDTFRVDQDWWVSADGNSGTGVYPNGMVGHYPATPQSVVEVSLSTDAAPRFAMDESGGMEWGDGVGARDASLFRVDTDVLGLSQELVLGTEEAIAWYWGTEGGVTGGVTDLQAGSVYFNLSGDGPILWAAVAGEDVSRAELTRTGDDILFGLRKNGDTNWRVAMHGDGTLLYSNGANAADMAIWHHPDGDGISIGDRARANLPAASQTGATNVYNDGSVYAEDSSAGAYAGLMPGGRLEMQMDNAYSDPALAYKHVDDADWRFTISHLGEIKMGNAAGPTDSSLFRASAGYFEIGNPVSNVDTGLVIHSPNGSRFAIKVSNAGALSAVAL